MKYKENNFIKSYIALVLTRLFNAKFVSVFLYYNILFQESFPQNHIMSSTAECKIDKHLHRNKTIPRIKKHFSKYHSQEFKFNKCEIVVKPNAVRLYSVEILMKTPKTLKYYEKLIEREINNCISHRVRCYDYIYNLKDRVAFLFGMSKKIPSTVDTSSTVNKKNNLLTLLEQKLSTRRMKLIHPELVKL